MKMQRLRGSIPAAAALVLATLVGCGGGGEEVTESGDTTTASTGTITTTISDPPTCKGPLAPSELEFENVWVTVTEVRAHISSDAGAEEGGWETLVDLTDDPQQIDLLSDPECVLATLGSTEGLPPGDYQQIRLHLLSNDADPATEATPSPNECDSTGGFNCVKPVAGQLQILLLNSQDINGIKIPPGRIEGGAISLEEGETTDINIDFNACNSIVQQGNGQFRLKPTLSAGEVSVTQDTLTGRVVSTATDDVLPGPATIIVLIEDDLDDDGIDDVVTQTLADPDTGEFSICPLPEGSEFDVVIAAIDDNGQTYNATVVLNVSAGEDLGDVGLEPEPENEGSTEPATLEGLVTSDDGSTGVVIDVELRALQEVDEGGSALLVTVPLFGDSTPAISTMEDTDSLCPTDTFCAEYTLIVPASNPRVGTFDSAGTSFSDPAANPAAYSVNARAFDGTEPNCTESSITTDVQDDGTTALEVEAGDVVTVEDIAFTGCTEVTTE